MLNGHLVYGIRTTCGFVLRRDPYPEINELIPPPSEWNDAADPKSGAIRFFLFGAVINGNRIVGPIS